MVSIIILLSVALVSHQCIQTYAQLQTIRILLLSGIRNCLAPWVYQWPTLTWFGSSLYYQLYYWSNIMEAWLHRQRLTHILLLYVWNLSFHVQYLCLALGCPIKVILSHRYHSLLWTDNLYFQSLQCALIPSHQLWVQIQYHLGGLLVYQ